jgi:hypothetical protein
MLLLAKCRQKGFHLLGDINPDSPARFSFAGQTKATLLACLITKGGTLINHVNSSAEPVFPIYRLTERRGGRLKPSRSLIL